MASWPAGAQQRGLITGAGSGIGAGTAEELARRGWQLALVDIDLEAAEAVAARCPGSVALSADITSQEAIEGAVGSAVAHLGGLDLCFANAGIATTGTLRRTDPELFAVQIDVNLTGTFRTLRAALPHLIDSHGYAMINASASALMAPPGLGAYGASKAGVESLGDTLRREVKHLGVDVGVVYLLWIATDMVQGAERFGDVFGTIRSSFRGPLGRTLTPEKASAAIVRGVERRSRKVTAPSWLGALYRLRGLPGLVERDAVAMAAAVDEATARDQERSAGLGGSLRTDTAASVAAAKAVEERK